MADPVALFYYKDERTGKEGINVLTSLANAHGEPIVVGVLPNMELGRTEVHELKTIHGKTSDGWLARPLYVNTLKATEFATTVPKIGKVVQQAQRPNSKILTENDFVKDNPPLGKIITPEQVDEAEDAQFSILLRILHIFDKYGLKTSF